MMQPEACNYVGEATLKLVTHSLIQNVIQFNTAVFLWHKNKRFLN